MGRSPVATTTPTIRSITPSNANSTVPGQGNVQLWLWHPAPSAAPTGRQSRNNTALLHHPASARSRTAAGRARLVRPGITVMAHSRELPWRPRHALRFRHVRWRHASEPELTALDVSFGTAISAAPSGGQQRLGSQVGGYGSPPAGPSGYAETFGPDDPVTGQENAAAAAAGTLGGFAGYGDVGAMAMLALPPRQPRRCWRS